AFLETVNGEKGGMLLVEAGEIAELLARLPEPPASAPGGSSSNTTATAARLGLTTAFLGKLGDDATAAEYRRRCAANGTGLSRFKTAPLPNARCLSLVTPDGQRTMRTDLAAASTLSPDEISPADFAGCRHAHIEGYLLFNPALADAVLASARAAGCRVSVDLASFEVVRAARPWILRQLATGLDAVFANEDEILALYPDTGAPADGGKLPPETCGRLARRLAAEGRGTVAAVKMGADGAWVARGGELHRVAPVRADALDSTGAGDTWAGAFLFGLLRGRPLPECGRLASFLGAECVRHLGAHIPEDRWRQLLPLVARGEL
ncbi:MAG: adenosine kinase, partial [Opitutaceae bacterium]|nr:adenosine kinase [Opitutaceae bacterium]